jgi:hypothetical protein
VLTYSYTVPGHDLEVGESRKRFEDENEADDWARALREAFVDVRVDPADVKRSVWEETAILTTPSRRTLDLDDSRLQAIGAWGTREALAAIVFCAAATGALFAACIQLSCLIGKPLISAKANGAAFFGMHTGAILCGIAPSLIAHRGKWSQSTWQRSLKTGATGIGMKILGAYTTVVFLYGWVRMSAKDGDSGYLGVLMFSAVWLVFYAGAAASSMQTLQHRQGNAS